MADGWWITSSRQLAARVVSFRRLRKDFARKATQGDAQIRHVSWIATELPRIGYSA